MIRRHQRKEHEIWFDLKDNLKEKNLNQKKTKILQNMEQHNFLFPYLRFNHKPFFQKSHQKIKPLLKEKIMNHFFLNLINHQNQIDLLSCASIMPSMPPTQYKSPISRFNYMFENENENEIESKIKHKIKTEKHFELSLRKLDFNQRKDSSFFLTQFQKIQKKLKFKKCDSFLMYSRKVKWALKKFRKYRYYVSRTKRFTKKFSQNLYELQMKRKPTIFFSLIHRLKFSEEKEANINITNVKNLLKLKYVKNLKNQALTSSSRLIQKKKSNKKKV